MDRKYHITNTTIFDNAIAARHGDGVGAPPESVPCSESLPSNGSEWVELLVNEMASSSNMDGAKSRASRVLEAFEKAVVSRVNAHGPHDFQKRYSIQQQDFIL
ncbi:hypothetical protein E2562_034578 [Oryza meyeriana var. granulata]|uniref:Uncharacterized protein n=1 Tax=Oryza meyeriana var. granulata TaxID=110450 RepID=A0A6G1ESN7_9ORYZ|nr:hypothetical protein E2562_034578 [Oryza meyeriana var. granulata]